MISDKDKKEYIDGGGCSCPFCGSDQLEGSSWNCDSSIAWQTIYCLDCERSWDDIYKLEDIEVSDAKD